jgi:hypothetical protein
VVQIEVVILGMVLEVPAGGVDAVGHAPPRLLGAGAAVTPARLLYRFCHGGHGSWVAISARYPIVSLKLGS